MPLSAISLFSGAGGMDIGFQSAGIDVIWANDFDRAACETYAANGLGHIELGDINKFIPGLKKFKGDVDIVFGGPPCQGFSVAGKMDPNDDRNKLVLSFLKTVELLKPKAFVMENVKALGVNPRWEEFRESLLTSFRNLGYGVEMMILTASDYGVPQKRERMFIVGLREDPALVGAFRQFLSKHEKPMKTVRETIGHLGPPGSPDNDLVCNAQITLAATPVLRKSPYAGMLFNGLGRPLNLDRPSTTLPASMGGNKTHIVDQLLLKNPSATDWIRDYHNHLIKGGKPYDWKSAPDNLRRLTANEALLLQTFPASFILKATRSASYRLIGNAVPCDLAKVVASTLKELMLLNNKEKKKIISNLQAKEELSLFNKDMAEAA